MKKYFAILLTVAMVFSLCSCTGKESTLKEGSLDESKTASSETQAETEKNAELDVFTETEGEVVGELAPIAVRNIANGDYKSAVINEINTAQKISKGDERDYNGLYNSNKISEISEFYLPALKIENYELTYITLSIGTFVYDYAPLDRDKSYSSYDNGIEVKICRPDYKDVCSFEEYVKINNLELMEESIAYSEWGEYNCAIDGEFNGVRFSITATTDFADYKYLRDIAYQIIKSELVDVQHELDVMKKNAD